MNFELGKKYIVKVSERGIVPIEEFDESRWYDKDHDDLDLLTDEEKIVVINQVLDKIKAEITEKYERVPLYDIPCSAGLKMVLGIIDKYMAEGSDKE